MFKSSTHLLVIIGVLILATNSSAFARPSRDCKVILYSLSKAKFGSYNTEQKIATYKKAIDVCPDEKPLRINYALELMNVKEFDEAETQLLYAESLGANLNISRALGYLYYKQQDFLKSEVHYRNALSRSGNDKASKEGLSLALKAQGKTEEYQELMTQVTVEKPDARILYNQAIAAQEAGDDARAEELYQAALKLDPKHWRSLHNLGRLKLKQEQYDEAINHLNAALAIKSDELPIAKAIASTLWKQKLFAEYEQHILNFSKNNPEHSEAFEYSLGSVYLKQKKFKDAEGMLTKVASREPSSKNLTSLAWAQIEQEKYDEAKRNLDKAILDDSENASAYNNLGVLYQRQGKKDKAKQAFTYATRRDPSNKMYQRNLQSISVN